jgi:cytoskeletal protein RodZ
MDETEPNGEMTVGQSLREAREAKGLSIEEIAATTRIPTRHLKSLEDSEWDKLPAATYSVGFAKNYAVAIGLDRDEISERLRAEMGGSRSYTASPEVFETVDPARTMPKGLVFGALGLLVIVVLGLMWLNNRSLEPANAPAVSEATGTPSDAPAPAAPAAAPVAAASGPVVLTANEPVWIQVKDGATTLKMGELGAGQSYEVPATAKAPQLTTGKPEALRIAVGTADAPAVGPAGKTVTGISLLGADLMRGPAPAAPVQSGQGGTPATAAPQATPAAQ